MPRTDITIGALARASGLARSTLLYYDRLGLLTPTGRTAGNYRLYSKEQVERLNQIRQYRRMGIPLKEISRLLIDGNTRASAAILKRRLQNLEQEIIHLRRQQRCIVNILEQTELREEIDMITKDKWVAVMSAAGLTEEDMSNWHIQFEKMEPDAHQEFLESLGIEQKEVAKIREWSRKGKH